jgi:general nucleoside transport system permease protein
MSGSASGTDPVSRGVLARIIVPVADGRRVVAVTGLALAAALGLSSLLIASTGGSPGDAVRALYDGSMASQSAWTMTLLYTAPLLLVALGACVSARSGVFNIGQEGQVLIGAFGSAWVALRLSLTGPALLVLALAGGALLGGAWAGLSAVMQRVRRVNVVVSTLLMTFLAQQFVAYAVNTPWLLQETRFGAGVGSPQSNQVPSSARLGSLGSYPNLQLNWGLVSAVVATVGVAAVLARTRWGFRLKMLGLNPLAARHAGVRAALLGGTALAISGAFAGLAGGVLLTSPIGTHRLQPGLSSNVGWDGLLVALVARGQPMVAVPVAVLFGVLRSGGSFLAATGVPTYLVDVVKALLVLSFVVPSVVIGSMRRRRNAVEPVESTPSAEILGPVAA